MSNQEVKSRLVSHLERAVENKGPVLNHRKNDNVGPTLGPVYVWQEVQAYAEARLKEAWKALVDEDLIDDDDTLREEGSGEERILVESDQFTCIASVSKPQARFDKEAFILAVSKKYKIKVSVLEALAKGCTKDSAAPLSKRILEV